jgi:hypothetical protein
MIGVLLVIDIVIGALTINPGMDSARRRVPGIDPLMPAMKVRAQAYRFRW